jgi:hypothetical protein
MNDDILKDIEPIKDAPIAPAHGIAAVALTLALKYHDINTVQDGALYQQYKLEGKNMNPFHLDHVFETAERMELWLLASSERIAKVIVEAVDDASTDNDAAS